MSSSPSLRAHSSFVVSYFGSFAIFACTHWLRCVQLRLLVRVRAEQPSMNVSHITR